MVYRYEPVPESSDANAAKPPMCPRCVWTKMDKIMTDQGTQVGWVCPSCGHRQDMQFVWPLR